MTLVTKGFVTALLCAAVAVAGCGDEGLDLPPPARSSSYEGANISGYTGNAYATSMVRDDIKAIYDVASTDVAFTPTWYMYTADDTTIEPSSQKSPSDDGLRQGLALARSVGLGTMLKPQVDVIDGTFRGQIVPADRAAWFVAYERMMLHYADIAQEAHVDLFCIGTELSSMSIDTAEWQRLIANVRARYGGAITFAANWNAIDQVDFWNELDIIGVDAYWPLAQPGEQPTVDSLVAAWRPHVQELADLSARTGKLVFLAELGYPSQPGAAAHPHETAPDEPADPEAQKVAYDAAFRAFTDQGWFRGIFWWDWRSDPQPDEDLSVEYTPRDKPAAEVMRVAQSNERVEDEDGH